MTHPEIDLQTINQWHDFAELVVDISGVDCALIMRANQDSMEVLTGSVNEELPCKLGMKVPLDTGLYSEAVINEQTPLHISNGRDDPRWRDSLDLDLGMVFFYGVPINWPDGKPFGVFCIMNRKERIASDTERNLIYRFSKAMETSLALLNTREMLHDTAINDFLTKIPNRHYFITQLQKEISRAKRYGQPLCLILMDFDPLTDINEREGIDTGDQTLIFFADMLKQFIRDCDLVARIGGDSFALLTPGTKLDQAVQLIERFHQVIDDHKNSAPVTDLHFSTGIAEFSGSDATFNGLLRRTLNILYMAKSKGRGKTCY